MNSSVDGSIKQESELKVLTRDRQSADCFCSQTSKSFIQRQGRLHGMQHIRLVSVNWRELGFYVFAKKNWEDNECVWIHHHN